MNINSVRHAKILGFTCDGSFNYNSGRNTNLESEALLIQRMATQNTQLSIESTHGEIYDENHLYLPLRILSQYQLHNMQ